jgi:hypothetical protein
MSIIAASRPTDWNFPLFIHVLGALLLVGGLVAGATTLALARGEARYLRVGYWSLLALALPGWLIMRVGAEWIYAKEGWDDLPEGIDEPTWLIIGYITADAGGLMLLIALILGGVGVRRLRAGKGSGLLKGTLVLSLFALAAYVVAVWAMSGKPG